MPIERVIHWLSVLPQIDAKLWTGSQRIITLVQFYKIFIDRPIDGFRRQQRTGHLGPIDMAGGAVLHDMMNDIVHRGRSEREMGRALDRCRSELSSHLGTLFRTR